MRINFAINTSIMILFLILSTSFLTSCSSDSGGIDNPVDPGNTDGNFTTGATTTYEINGGSEIDISAILPGVTAVAPQHSTGTLMVAPITEAPSLSFDATMAQVSYTGGDGLSLEVERSEGDEVIAFAFGSLNKACFDGRTGTTDWWGISPSSETGGAATFDIPISEMAIGKAAGTSAAPKTINLAIATLPAGSTEKTTLDAIRTSVRQSVDFWLDNLPAGIAANARKQIDGDLSYTISWSNDGNAYQHGDNWLSSNAVFYLTKDVQADIVAHEVGHYMTHVLCGYDRYEEIYNRFPTDFWGSAVEHGIGDYREGRLDLLEDYAYFSTYMITGSLQAVDLVSTPMLWTLLKNHKPDDVDYPSHEAYGASMMGALLRSEKESYTHNKKIVPAPAIDASLSDVLGILARGPRDVNELREFISDYLRERGTDYQYMLPAVLEPMGWTYNGLGKVIDENGDIVTDAEVRSISQTGEGEYAGSISTKTGSDGTYYLPTIYPGSNLLRVYYNAGADSADFSYTAPWEDPTNGALNLPDFTVVKKKQGEKKLSGTFSETKTVKSENDNPVITITASGEWTAEGEGLILESDNYGTTYLTCAPGSSGKITITATAELSGNTYEETNSWGDRKVYTFHEPKLLPLGDTNFNADDSIQVTTSGGESRITVEYTFPADDYFASLQFPAQFEVRYSCVAYNKDGDLINSFSDEWWMNYGFGHLYMDQSF